VEYPAIKKQIVDQFQSLSPQLRVAAQYVLDRPDDVALNSMRTVAGLADVQPATMVRLARALGFESYKEFRIPFSARLTGKKAEYSERARKLQAREVGIAEQSLFDDLKASSLENIDEAFRANSPDKLETFCQKLIAANHIYVLGLRGSFPVAFAFHYSYRMFRRNATLLDGQGGTFADNLRALSKDDVLFVVGFSPYTGDTVRTIDYASRLGATILTLTDSIVSPLAEKADQALLVPSFSPSFNQSFVAPLAIAEALVGMLAAKGGERALGDIETSEKQLSDFRAYWEESPGRKKRRKL